MLYGRHRTYLAWVTGDKHGKAVCSLLSPQSKSPYAQGAVLLGQPEVVVVGNGGDARDVAMSRRARGSLPAGAKLYEVWIKVTTEDEILLPLRHPSITGMPAVIKQEGEPPSVHSSSSHLLPNSSG